MKPIVMQTDAPGLTRACVLVGVGVLLSLLICALRALEAAAGSCSKRLLSLSM